MILFATMSSSFFRRLVCALLTSSLPSSCTFLQSAPQDCKNAQEESQDGSGSAVCDTPPMAGAPPPISRHSDASSPISEVAPGTAFIRQPQPHTKLWVHLLTGLSGDIFISRQMKMDDTLADLIRQEKDMERECTMGGHLSEYLACHTTARLLRPFQNRFVVRHTTHVATATDTFGALLQRQKATNLPQEPVDVGWNPEPEWDVEGLFLCVLQTPQALLLTGSSDGTAKVWSADSGECLQTFSEKIGHLDYCSSVSFSPIFADRVLTVTSGFSVNSKRTARVWDVTSGRCLQTLQQQELRQRTGGEDGGEGGADGRNAEHAVGQNAEHAGGQNAEPADEEDPDFGETLQGRFSLSAEGSHDIDGSLLEVHTVLWDKKKDMNIVRTWNAETGHCLATHKIPAAKDYALLVYHVCSTSGGPPDRRVESAAGARCHGSRRPERRLGPGVNRGIVRFRGVTTQRRFAGPTSHHTRGASANLPGPPGPDLARGVFAGWYACTHVFGRRLREAMGRGKRGVSNHPLARGRGELGNFIYVLARCRRWWKTNLASGDGLL